MRKELEEKLLRQTHLTVEQLLKAKEEQKKTKKSLFSVLIKLGYLTEEDVYAFFAQQTQIPLIKLSDYEIDAQLISLFSEEFYRENLLLPVFKIENTLFIAMANPLNADLVKEVKMKTELEVSPLFCEPKSVLKKIDEIFGPEDSLFNLESFLMHFYFSSSTFIFCRESERTAVNIPVEIKINDKRVKLIFSDWISATVCDVSQSGKGMGIKIIVFVPPQINLLVKFSLKDSEHLVKAQVVRCRMIDKGGYFLGLRILEMDKNLREEILR